MSPSSSIPLCLALAGLTFAQDRRPLIAVMPISSKALDVSGAETVTDALATELVNTGSVRVMERSEMRRILAEQSFSSSGACDSTDCTLQIGRLLMVDQLVVGSLGQIGNTFSFNARLVSIKSGEIVKAVTRNGRANLDIVLSDLVPAVAAGLVNAPDTSTHRGLAKLVSNPTPSPAPAPPPAPLAKLEPTAPAPASATPPEVKSEPGFFFRWTPYATLDFAKTKCGENLICGSSEYTEKTNEGFQTMAGVRFEFVLGSKTPPTGKVDLFSRGTLGIGLQTSIGVTTVVSKGDQLTDTATINYQSKYSMLCATLGARLEAGRMLGTGLYGAVGIDWTRPLSGTEEASRNVRNSNYPYAQTSSGIKNYKLVRVSEGDVDKTGADEVGVMTWSEFTFEFGWETQSGWRFGMDFGSALTSFLPDEELNSSDVYVFKSRSEKNKYTVERFGLSIGKSFAL